MVFLVCPWRFKADRQDDNSLFKIDQGSVFEITGSSIAFRCGTYALFALLLSVKDDKNFALKLPFNEAILRLLLYIVADCVL